MIVFILLCAYIYTGWAPQISGTTANLHDVFFPSDTLTGYICGDSGIILKTTNSGNQWTRQTTPVTTKLNAIYFLGDTGWVVGSELTVLSTTNGGGTWSGSSTPGGLTLYDVHFTNNSFGIIIGDRGFCTITRDGGMTWQVIIMPTDNTLRSMFFINNSTGWLVGDRGICLGTLDGGSNWANLSIPEPYNLRGIYFINYRGHAIGDAGSIFKTTNAGLNRYQLISPTLVNLYGIDFEDNDTGYICGDSGFVAKLYRHYTIINPSITLFSINFPAPMVGWTVGSNGSIYKTSDGMAVTEVINKKDINPILCDPNPFTNYLSVKISSIETVRLKIYNAAGKVILERKVTRNKLSLDTRNLPKGVYFLKAKNRITQIVKI
ncbi:MAG: YCF48-related protein [candidate division WOR-3 bacterium]|nr:YCF48-related protein [candidate division WOR-3 bacterium]MDH5684195.1 YCF48-related protein [candidate division WOR-3 bacterium]